MASLEYVMTGWLRSRRLMVASVAAGRGCWGLRPRLLLCQGGGLGRDFMSGDGRLGGRGGGRPCLPSGGISPVYLVPLWDLISGVTRQMGWVLLSSNLPPCGLSGALLPLLSSRWCCQVTVPHRLRLRAGGGTGWRPRTRYNV